MTERSSRKQGAPPQAMQAHFGLLATHAVLSALELGLLQRLADGPATARGLARSAGTDLRATTMVLDALVGLGQLDKRGNRYQLPAAIQSMLNSPGVDPETHFGDTLSHLKQIVADWSKLTEAVKTGKPVLRMRTAKEGESVFHVLARRLFPGNYQSAKALRKALPSRLRRPGLSIIDVGAGSAAWSIPFAEADGSTEVVAVDFPGVLPVARHFTRACGVEDRYTFTAGDIRRLRFGTERYDLAILGHVCHSEGPKGTQRLFRKMHRTLRPGGSVIVLDMFPDEGRTGKGAGPFPLLFALNMLVHTQEGGTFTVGEYRRWAAEAGFKSVRAIGMEGGPPALLVTKGRHHG